MRGILGYLAPSRAPSSAVLGVVWFGLVGLVGKYNEKYQLYSGKIMFFSESDKERGTQLVNFGGILGLMQAILGHLVSPRGAFCAVLGQSWGNLEPSLRHLGPC